MKKTSILLIIIFTTLGVLGCGHIRYQVRIENHSSDDLIVSLGILSRSINACSIVIDDGINGPGAFLFRPSWFIQARTLDGQIVYSQKLRPEWPSDCTPMLTVTIPAKGSVIECPLSIETSFILRVDNLSTRTAYISYRGKAIGSVSPGKNDTIGPINGTLECLKQDITVKLKDNDNTGIDAYTQYNASYIIGNIPELTLVIKQL